jgi:hypothetical protein
VTRLTVVISTHELKANGGNAVSLLQFPYGFNG